MRGYPLFVAGLTTAFFMLPSNIGKSQRMYLGSGVVKADRKSPAFSAIEDAFVLKDFVIEKSEAKKTPSKKINLKGLKLSSRNSKRKIVLRGEKIEVAHFTNKFIKKTNTFGHRVQLASMGSNWNNVKDVSSKIEVVNLKPQIDIVNNVNTDVRALSNGELERVELPSGIVLTKPVAMDKLKGQKNSRFSNEDIVATSPRTISYGSALKIRGSIELDGGDVSFDRGNYVYHLERTLDGHIFETGAVSALDSNFEIEVADLKGLLSIELRSLEGDVLAYGEHNLSYKDDADKLSLTLFPSEDLFSGRVLKNELSKDGVEVAEVDSSQKVSGVEGELETTKEGYFNESLFEKGSSFVVETKVKDRWPELNIGVSGKPLYPRLSKRTFLQNLAKTIDPFGEEIDVRSLLMGSITQQGLFQREIKVRLYKQEHQKALYFNSHRNIEHTLEVTSSSGLFAFANLPSGGYLVQALRGDKLLAQKWFIVKEGHISRGQIELNKKTTAVASTEVFPGRTKTSAPFLFEEMGVEVDFELGQSVETQIDLKSNPQLAVFKSKANEDFGQHIYVTSAKLMKKRFKLVSKTWLETFLNTRRSNANRALGTVVGLMMEESFSVVKKSSNSISENSQVFYFDKNGELTERGVAGGGFIITDVQPGIKTTVLLLRSKQKFLNKISIAKPYSVSIF